MKILFDTRSRPLVACTKQEPVDFVHDRQAALVAGIPILKYSELLEKLK